MGGACNKHGGLVRKPKGKRPLGIPRSTREDNIKMDLKERGWNGLECVHPNQVWEKWQDFAPWDQIISWLVNQLATNLHLPIYQFGCVSVRVSFENGKKLRSSIKARVLLISQMTVSFSRTQLNRICLVSRITNNIRKTN